MRTPPFWQQKNLIARALLPLSKLYEAGRRAHLRYANPMEAYIPVVCIGNATAGGAGKTPTALALGTLLKARGINAMYLTRGYGGRMKGPAIISTADSAKETGDEALLLAGLLPTIVSKNRKDGAILAENEKASLIVMDDGLQNPSLFKDLSLMVIDSHYGFGNGYTLPAGPLREPAADALDRADAFIIIGNGSNLPSLPEDRPVIHATLAPNDSARHLAGKKVHGFCGIAHPEKFFTTLRELGAEVLAEKPYDDHAFYSDTEIVRLAAKARAQEALLCTTRKDAVRINPELHGLLTVVDVTLTFAEPEKLMALIDSVLHEQAD